MVLNNWHFRKVINSFNRLPVNTSCPNSYLICQSVLVLGRALVYLPLVSKCMNLTPVKHNLPRSLPFTIRRRVLQCYFACQYLRRYDIVYAREAVHNQTGIEGDLCFRISLERVIKISFTRMICEYTLYSL